MDQSCQIAVTGLVGILHELNNPLTNILLSAELLAAATDDAKEEYLSIIRKSSEQMQAVIRDLSESFIQKEYSLHLNDDELQFTPGSF